jgi:hypothetical protein
MCKYYSDIFVKKFRSRSGSGTIIPDVQIKNLAHGAAYYSHLREVDNLDEAEEAGPRLSLQVFRAAPDTAVLPTDVHTL